MKRGAKSYVITVLLLLAVMTPNAAQAVEPVIDLWVSKLQVDDDPDSPSYGLWKVWTRKVGSGSVPPGCWMTVLTDSLGYWVELGSFLVTDLPEEYHSGTADTLAGTGVRVIIDNTYVVDEMSETNNMLNYLLRQAADNPCDPYPCTMTIDDPSMELECRKKHSLTTGWWPYAFLILPPYEVDEATLLGEMSTKLEIGEFHGAENEYAAGLTASLAIETSCGLPLVAQGKVGREIKLAVEVALGRGVEQTSAETFSAITSASMGPTTGDHTVVLCQTKYDICEYEVVAGDSVGATIWVAIAKEDDEYDNPELAGVKLSDYENLKDPDAVGLNAHHTIGNSDSYDDVILHDYDHIDADWFYDPQFLSVKGQLVGTADADWSQTIKKYGSAALMLYVECNMYAQGEIGGASVKASFGSSRRWSHKIWEGRYTTFHWHIGPVDSMQFSYKVTGFAENVVFSHGDREHDALLLMCYAVKEQSTGRIWERWEHFVEYYWDWFARCNKWYNKNPGSLLKDHRDVVIDPDYCDFHRYIDQMQKIISNYKAWGEQLTEEEAPGLDDFVFRTEEINDLLEYIRRLSNPDDKATSPLLQVLIEDANEKAEEVFNLDPSWVDPEIPERGKYVAIEYSTILGSIPEGAPNINLQWGCNGWQDQQSMPMAYIDSTGVWRAAISIPDTATIIDYLFQSGGIFDNNGGVGWHIPTTDTLRTHDNGNVELSLASYGTLGFTDEAHTTGRGFRFSGNNYLHIGSLWVSGGGWGELDPWVANRDYDAEPDPEWGYKEGTPKGIWFCPQSEVLQTQLTHTAYTNAGSANPREILVLQGGASRIEPDDDFVIVSYHIQNEGPSFDSLSIGLFADFDLGTPVTWDSGGTDSTRQLAYMYRNGATPHVGVCLLDSLIENTPVITLIPIDSYPDYIPDAEKYNYLTGQPGYVTLESGNASNWGVLVSTGPLEFPAGASYSYSFAIVAGENLDSLQVNAYRARQWFLHRDVQTGIDWDAAGRISRPTLFQNFPNPFNPSTRISFLLPHRTHVKLQVFDVSGRAIRTLQDGHMDAGKWDIPWDGENDNARRVSSGIYFYRLVTEFGEKSRKMVLLR